MLEDIKKELEAIDTVIQEFKYISTPEAFKQYLELYPRKELDCYVDGKYIEWTIGPLKVQENYRNPGVYQMYLNNNRIGAVKA